MITPDEFILDVISPSLAALVEYRIMGWNAKGQRHFPIFTLWSDKVLRSAPAEDRVYFFSPGLRRQGTSVVIGSNVIWADFDAVATASALPAFLLPPSVIIRTGGGFHVYWRLDDFQDSATVAGLVDVVARAHGSDPKARDVTRFMRLPGSWNVKYSPPRFCSIVASADVSYSPAQIREVCCSAVRSVEYTGPTLGRGATLYRRGDPGEWHFWQASQPYEIGGDGPILPYEYSPSALVDVYALGGRELLYSGSLAGVPLGLVGYLSEVRVLRG